MNKIVLTTIITSGVLYANNSQISYEYGIKNFSNSMTKKDNAKIRIINFSHKMSKHKIKFGYQSDNVKREHSIKKMKLPSLDIEKYSAKYLYKLNDNLNLKASYIKIIDNLAPTDQGKIYGLGANYAITKGLNTKIDIYRSNYKDFDVKQFDLGISKAFKIDNLKLKASLLAKKIDISGSNYGNYIFEDKDYFTTGLKFVGNYKGYIGAVGAFFGERIFTVLDDGVKVQHHAMQQDKTYMLSFGKKFKDFDIFAKYSFQNGKELPENRDNVDTKIVSLLFTYKF